MVEYCTGNLFESDAEALVNAVNCVGVMGKGIALQFKKAFPDYFIEYKKACEDGHIRIGDVFTVSVMTLFEHPKYIISLPTKRHWREKSKLEYIEQGIHALVTEVRRLNIKSIAIPALGCGNGGLDWGNVQPLMESVLGTLENVDVKIYAPRGGV